MSEVAPGAVRIRVQDLGPVLAGIVMQGAKSRRVVVEERERRIIRFLIAEVLVGGEPEQRDVGGDLQVETESRDVVPRRGQRLELRRKEALLLDSTVGHSVYSLVIGGVVAGLVVAFAFDMVYRFLFAQSEKRPVNLKRMLKK